MTIRITLKRLVAGFGTNPNLRLACAARRSLHGFSNRAEFGHRGGPIGKQSIAFQVRHAKIDLYLQPTHVRKVSPAASRSENTVIEYHVSIYVAGKDHARHDQVGSYQTGASIQCAQAIGELSAAYVVAITLRRYGYMPGRNSNLLAWVAFARGLDASRYCPVFVPDTNDTIEGLPKELRDFQVFPEVAWQVPLRWRSTKRS